MCIGGHASSVNMESRVSWNGKSVFARVFIDLADGRSFAVRPSGTEPKIKYYLFAHGAAGAELIAAKAEVECSISKLWAAVEADAYTRMA